MRKLKYLDGYESNTSATVILIEETLSDGDKAYSVKLKQEDGEVILDFYSHNSAVDFYENMKRY